MVGIASACQSITPEGEDADSGSPYTFLIYYTLKTRGKQSTVTEVSNFK